MLKSKMKLTFVAVMVCFCVSLMGQIPAFPGAEGFGAYSTGGRGGDVYTVTSLNNSGSGTLRDALDTAPSSGRTIVFAVSGYIPVNSDTNFQVPSNVTIAGQTAPGDGIGLQGGRMIIVGDNTVMRHFRIRHGKYGTGGDCLNIAEGINNTIVDHVSLMFSTDENFSFFGEMPNNFTMQYTSTSWGMERHNAGGLWDLNQGSCHHSLWAHHTTRNPKARPNMLEWINNVTFDYGTGFIMGDSQTDIDWKANVIGCYYLSIPSYRFGRQSKGLTSATIASDGEPNFSLYLDDCLYDYDDDGMLDGVDRGYDIVEGQPYPEAGTSPGTRSYFKSDVPFEGAPVAVTIDDPLTAYKKVLSSVGPLRLDAGASSLRDELDTLLINSVVDQECIMIAKDSPQSDEAPPSNGEQLLADKYGISNAGFGTLNSTAAPVDTDWDGMPDLWEIIVGTDPEVQDHNKVFANDGEVITDVTFFPVGTPAGYTYLEEFLHFCAIPHGAMFKSTAATPSTIRIDVSRYTPGFMNSPEFSIDAAYNGTVKQYERNGVTESTTGPIIMYTPDEEFYGRAGFHFTVTDADGSSWQQFFAVFVITDHVDDGPAMAPEKLSAVQGDSVVWLNWYENIEEDIAGYNVERGTEEGGPYTVIATDLSEASYTDDDVTNGTDYYYVVTAVDIDDNVSEYSNEATATPTSGADYVAPSVPTNLTVSASVSEALLDWDDNTEADLAGYNVLRSLENGGPYDIVAELVSGSSYTDDSVSSGMTYYYVVTAVDSASNESGVSNEAAGVVSGMSYAVNCGGEESGSFVTDAYYTGGSTYTSAGTIDMSGLARPAPEAVYQVERHGDFSYIFDGLGRGVNYRVRLHFAEIYHTSSGSRSFDVAINGLTVLSDYDIYSITGARYKAHIEDFIVAADENGKIEIEFTTVLDNSLICGIEVLYEGVPDPTGGPSEDALYGNGTVFEDTNSGFNGIGYVNFPSSGGYLEFSGIGGGGGGAASLEIRYANGSSGSRTGNLIINGEGYSITFDSTGAWNTWAMMDRVIMLNSGTGNIIRFESIGQDLANIDEIAVMPLEPYFTADPISNLDGIEDGDYAGTSLVDKADDPQGIETVTFSKDTGPGWLIVADDGSLSGVPGVHDIGLNTFMVRVTDEEGYYDTAEMTIDVANIYSGSKGIVDLYGFAEHWLMSDCADIPACDGASLDGDNDVDMMDFGILSIQWLLDESLELSLQFDDPGSDILDSSNYHRDCLGVNGPVKDAAGSTGNGIVFDGQDDYIVVEDYAGVPGSGSRTVAAWIKVNEDLSNTDNSIYCVASWGMGEIGKKWAMIIDETSGQLALSVWGMRVKGGADMEDGSWHHVAAVLPDGASNLNQVKLYVDGDEVATNAASLDMEIDTSNTENVVIGAVDTDVSEGVQIPIANFKGAMDDVRIYSAALSPSEIAFLGAN